MGKRSEVVRGGLSAPSRASRNACFLLALAIGLVTASPGAAAEESDEDRSFHRSGFYVGLGGSYQHNAFEDPLEDALDDEFGNQVVDLNLDLDDSGGIHVVAGYRAFSFFALELEYEWVSEYDVSIEGVVDIPPQASLSTRLYSIEGHTLTANTKWIVPLNRFQPYFLLGGGLAVSDVDRGSLFDLPIVGDFLDGQGIDVDEGTHTEAAGRAAIGLDLYITPNVLVNASAGVVVTTLEEPDVEDIDDLNYMSFQLGLQYRF